MKTPCFRYRWDVVKARSNRRKHGVSFEAAANVFSDPLAITIADPEHSDVEERWITLGLVPDTGLLVVVHALVESSGDEIDIRIISARRASKREQRDYEGGDR